MKYTSRIPCDFPDEYKHEWYQKERERFAIKLLDFLEQQTYPLLIISFDEESKQEYKHLDRFDRRMQNLLYDEYTWEMELGRVEVRHHQPFIMTRMEELSYKDLSISALDEIKNRIRRKFKK